MEQGKILHMEKQWFETWFDSSYYHLLYSTRDHKEAEAFIEHLVSFLNPTKGDHIMDLGCGKGRHSIFLNNLGYKVTGVDLSENNISSLLELNSDSLHFEVWDMRMDYKKSEFEYVFNLFTSFGYFDNHDENLKVLKAVNHNLKDKGILVLDFLNENLVKKSLPDTHVIDRGGVKFNISKREERDSVIKHISFVAEDVAYEFEEKVQLIDKETFSKLLSASGFEIKEVFGDYDLNEFEKGTSPRIIFVAQKM